jgi:hypothetical protein
MSVSSRKLFHIHTSKGKNKAKNSFQTTQKKKRGEMGIGLRSALRTPVAADAERPQQPQIH